MSSIELVVAFMLLGHPDGKPPAIVAHRQHTHLREWSDRHYPEPILLHRPGPGYAWHRVRWEK